jgi:hypothetical protein
VLFLDELPELARRSLEPLFAQLNVYAEDFSDVRGQELARRPRRRRRAQRADVVDERSPLGALFPLRRAPRSPGRSMRRSMGRMALA